MADAADEAGEYETGECLRFLWKHRQTVGVDLNFHGEGKHSYHWAIWCDKGNRAERFWSKMPEAVGRDARPCAALDRVLVAWPKHKHLLIDALEKETVT